MKKNLIHKSTTYVFLGVVFALTITNLCSPKQTYSENENRTLAPFPSLSFSNITGGQFDDEFETWFADHFFARDAWIQAKAAARITAGANENNSVYLGKDGHLLGAFNTFNPDTIKMNIQCINEFAQDTNTKINIMIVPGAVSSDASDLPFGAYNLNEEDMLKQIGIQFSQQNYINLSAVLKDQDAYFKTDHHWNVKGAYIAYQEICSSVLHTEPQQFTYTQVADDFKGTMYSKSGAFWTKGEPMYRIDPKTQNDVTVTIDQGKVMNSLYNEESLNGKDKYTYYLDGNHGYERIQTSVNNGKKTVIVKDSYAHILVPFLAQEYSEIDLVDLRYYRDAVSRLITDKETTDVYIIYSLDEFASDKSLAALW